MIIAKANDMRILTAHTPIPIKILDIGDLDLLINKSDATKAPPAKNPPIAPPITGKMAHNAGLLPQVSKKTSGRIDKIISYHVAFGVNCMSSPSI